MTRGLAASLGSFFRRSDPEYDRFVEHHQARSGAAKTGYILLHLAPGLLGYLAIFHLREPLMALTGLSSKNTQWFFVLCIGIGWMIVLPFVLLLRVERLTLRQATRFLGLGTFDWKGLLVVMPVVTLIMLVPAAPFALYVHPVLFKALNAVPALHIPEWHLTREFYQFPFWQLLVILVANYLGEEIYFRGYLMKKIGFCGSWTWVASNALFELYHVHQAPNNWPYVLIAFLLPFGLLMQWRKNLYVVIGFHLVVNHVVPLLLAWL